MSINTGLITLPESGSIVAPRSTWVEETYHSILPGDGIGATKKQTGKKTLLERISGAANSFFGGIRLPTIDTNVEIQPQSRTMVYVAIAVAALFLLRKK